MLRPTKVLGHWIGFCVRIGSDPLYSIVRALLTTGYGWFEEWRCISTSRRD